MTTLIAIALAVGCITTSPPPDIPPPTVTPEPGIPSDHPPLTDERAAELRAAIDKEADAILRCEPKGLAFRAEVDHKGGIDLKVTGGVPAKGVIPCIIKVAETLRMSPGAPGVIVHAVHRKPTKKPTQQSGLEAIKAPGRIVAVGDLHGDFDATVKVLHLAGVLDKRGQWSGGNTTLVQTGDVLDRGDGEHLILQLLDKLATEAKAAGGQVVQLSGNHEIMNARKDFRYVTEAAMDDFGGGGPEGRAAAFRPGGPQAKRLANYPVVAKVNDTLFAHGGVRLADAPNLRAINAATRAWLLGRGPFPEALDHRESVIWTRFYAPTPLSEAACTELAEVLRQTQTSRLVVGHSVQKIGITHDCNQTLWRIDVGMSAHYGGTPAALEINREAARVLP